MSLSIHSETKRKSPVQESGVLEHYLGLISYLSSKKDIEKPLSDYKPSRLDEGAYWRKTDSPTTQSSSTQSSSTQSSSTQSSSTTKKNVQKYSYDYDDDDDEYQQYLKQAVEESLENYCDRELCDQLSEMVVSSSAKKPSLKGQYELSRSYYLTKQDDTVIGQSKKKFRPNA